MRVMVGNSVELQCDGKYIQVPLQHSEAVFMIDLLLLPVFGVDIVLGVNWLTGLGPTIFDYH